MSILTKITQLANIIGTQLKSYKSNITYQLNTPIKTGDKLGDKDIWEIVIYHSDTLYNDTWTTLTNCPQLDQIDIILGVTISDHQPINNESGAMASYHTLIAYSPSTKKFKVYPPSYSARTGPCYIWVKFVYA